MPPACDAPRALRPHLELEQELAQELEQELRQDLPRQRHQQTGQQLGLALSPQARTPLTTHHHCK